MADDKTGTSADADVPEENDTEMTDPTAEAEPSEAPSEAADAPLEPEATEPEAAAEIEDVEAAVEPEAPAEPDAATEPEVEAAEPEVAAASEEAAADSPGTSAEAEAPAVAQSGPKKKSKRLPRAQRPARTRPKREVSTTRKPIVRLDKPDHERGRRQERFGTVVSDAMDKTIVVKVEVLKAHPKYKKVVRRSTSFHAHDERSEAKVGDVVRIVETRPLSKTKRWRLVEVVEAAK
jgi:small subunit ribosomal protein S17